MPTPVKSVAPHQRGKVTQKNLDKGVSSDSRHCATQLGIADSIPGSSHIIVDVAKVAFTKDGKRYVYMTPTKVQQLILNYDLGEKDKVKPITFTLTDGLVYDVIRRPGVGGRPAGTRIKGGHTIPKALPKRDRRTYGARSMTTATT